MKKTVFVVRSVLVFGALFLGGCSGMMSEGMMNRMMSDPQQRDMMMRSMMSNSEMMRSNPSMRQQMQSVINEAEKPTAPGPK